ncbi:DUF5069 domain-containing protein [Verrucomicrobium spinosum]|uniref:DUF5069 domain-containing protein n=1 Tax=Verrucomicrobium spinosum TaxID=2736 RepID=UPI0031B574F9
MVRTLEGGTNEELLAWCFRDRKFPNDEQILVWNSFLIKRGWRDSGSPGIIEPRLPTAGRTATTFRPMWTCMTWMKPPASVLVLAVQCRYCGGGVALFFLHEAGPVPAFHESSLRQPVPGPPR